MNGNFIILNNFIITNNTNKDLLVKVLVDDKIMISQSLKPNEQSSPIVFTPSTKGALEFQVFNLNTGLLSNVSTCIKLVCDGTISSPAMGLLLNEVNDLFIMEVDYVQISRVTFNNDALVVSSFAVSSANRGIIDRTSLIAIRQSRTIDLKQFNLPTGEEITSIAFISGGPRGVAAPIRAIYHPDSPFPAVYVLTGSLFGVNFVRNR